MRPPNYEKQARRSTLHPPSSVLRPRPILPGLPVGSCSSVPPVKRNLESSLNRARFWLYAGNHVESEEEIRNRACFHARDTRFAP